MFDKPGVYYNHILGEVDVSREYWEHVGGRQNETLDHRYLRRRRNRFLDQLDDIFEVNGCGVIPKDLLGSPQFPVDIRGADEDAMDVVTVGDKGIAPVNLAFDDLDENLDDAAADGGKNEGNYVEGTDEDDYDELNNDMDDDGASVMTMAGTSGKRDLEFELNP